MGINADAVEVYYFESGGAGPIALWMGSGRTETVKPGSEAHAYFAKLLAPAEQAHSIAVSPSVFSSAAALETATPLPLETKPEKRTSRWGRT